MPPTRSIAGVLWKMLAQLPCLRSSDLDHGFLASSPLGDPSLGHLLYLNLQGPLFLVMLPIRVPQGKRQLDSLCLEGAKDLETQLPVESLKVPMSWPVCTSR